MLRLVICLGLFAFAKAEANDRIIDIAFPGTFDELVSSNGEYRIEGRASQDDMFGYSVSLSSEENTFYSCISSNRIYKKDLYVENHCDKQIRLRSIPAGVQTITWYGDVSLMPCQTNSSVVCLTLEMDFPSETNTVKKLLSSFPNLEVLVVKLGYSGRPNDSFDVREFLVCKKLQFLYVKAYHPEKSSLKNLESLEILRKRGVQIMCEE